VQLCAVEEVDMVITDETASRPIVATLRERGCEVVIAR